MIDPYSRLTTIDLWTDEYISKNMLKAHLNPNIDAASRKPETIKKTVEFISNKLPKSSSICDFGCGPGLYTNLLNQKGFKVTGVDISVNSLEYAKSQNKTVNYIKLNYVNEFIPHKVDFAMLIYCDFGALDPMSQTKLLSNIHQSLTEEGLFFFDVMSDNWFKRQKEMMNHSIQTDGFFIKGEAEVTSKRILYPELKLSLEHHHIEGTKIMDFYNWDKSYTQKELEILLNDNHFEVVEYFSDTCGNKHFNASDTLAILCKKKKQ